MCKIYQYLLRIESLKNCRNISTTSVRQENIEKRRGLSPGGRFPPSFIHQVIIITGLNKLQLYVLALKMALDADRA